MSDAHPPIPGAPADGAPMFLSGGGETGAMMRAHDWSRSPLGHPAGWPQALRTVVALMLNSKFPMFVAWGEQLSFLYNDAYRQILGEKHPASLGAPFSPAGARPPPPGPPQRGPARPHATLRCGSWHGGCCCLAPVGCSSPRGTS